MDSLLRHGIRTGSENISACTQVFDKEVQLVKQSPLGPGTYLQLLLDRGADPFSDGGPFEVEFLLDFVIKQGAKQEMKLLKGLDEHSISSEELEEIVTEVESQIKRRDKQNIAAPSSCMLPKEAPRNDANILAILILPRMTIQPAMMYEFLDQTIFLGQQMIKRIRTVVFDTSN